MISALVLSACGAGSKSIFVPPPPPELSIRMFPQIAMVQSPIRIICQLPSNAGEGIYLFGAVDRFASGGPIDRLQISREMLAPCEPFTVYCGYEEHGKKAKMTSQTFTPVGECSK